MKDRCSAVTTILVGAIFYLTTGLQVSLGASFSKEFVSASHEGTRSMEPSSDLELKIGGQGMDIGKALCENYQDWSEWSSCSRKCEQTRVRRCAKPDKCGRTWVKEKRTCVRDRGSCSPLSYKVIGIQKRNRMIEELLYDLLYHPWTPWGRCTRSCKQQRTRQCKYAPICVDSYIQEERRCVVKGSKCEHRFSLKPVAISSIGKQYIDYIINNSLINLNDSSHNNNSDFSKTENGSKLMEAWLLATDNVVDVDDDVDKDGDDGVDRDEGKTSQHVQDEKKGDKKSGGKSVWRKKKGMRRSKKQRRRARKKRRNKELATAQKKCGIRPSKAFTGSYKVVGGQEVKKNSWPWQVAILTKYHEQYCGGTLITPRWVLTAAHCVRKNGKRRKLIVRVGEHDMEEYQLTREDIRPEKEFPHPDFDYHTITNDIALIKLRHAPSVYTRAGFACLPDANFAPRRDQLCSIVGWGKLKSTHVYGSSALHEAEVPVVKHKRCQRVFKYRITDDQVCAGYKRGGIDSCAGDSGGPLLCKDKTDRYTLYGVTSYGEGCGLKGKYGIYSKVTSYLSWINKTISDNR